MSRKIIGVTVGTTLPKPNFDQTDPNKGDFIKGDRSFLNAVKTVNGVTPDDNGNVAVMSDVTLTQSGQAADAKVVGDSLLNKVDVDDTIAEEEIDAICGAAIDPDGNIVNAGRITEEEIDAICGAIIYDGDNVLL